MSGDKEEEALPKSSKSRHQQLVEILKEEENTITRVKRIKKAP